MSSTFYVARESALHRLHPVTRIILLALSFAAALVLEHPLWLMALGLVFALAGARSGAFQGLRRVIWLLLLIGLASFLIRSLDYNGKTLVFVWGPLTVSREGMLFGAGMGVRLDLMIFCGLIFLATTPVEDFTYGLTRLGLPFAVSFALSLSFRLVPLFADTVRSIQDAQKARGLDPEAGGILARLRSYPPLLVPVFAAALRRADQLAIALESKGFGLPAKRGSYREFHAGLRDGLAIAFMGLVIIVEVMCRLGGMGMINR